MMETYLVILHDTLELDNSDESENLEVLLDFLICRPQEELNHH